MLMHVKSSLKKFVERMAKVHIYGALPRGLDLFEDIRRSFPNFSLDIFFDVGANKGQSIKLFLERFPNSNIYAFEPSLKTYRDYLEQYNRSDKIVCSHIALGAKKRNTNLVHHGQSDQFFLADSSPENVIDEYDELESIEVNTLDGFCSENHVDHIDFLKIDTEGCDLRVLKGAEEMLTKGRVAFVEVEAGMNRENKRHVPFEELKNYLEDRGYYLFGIYEQVNEWPAQKQHLRRTNSVFVSSHLVHPAA